MRYHIPRPAGIAALVCAVLLATAGQQVAEADTGNIAGHANAQSGSVLSVPFGGPATTMDPSGAPQSAGAPLNRTQNTNLGLLGSLSAGVTSSNATQQCSGQPAGSPVVAECFSRVENAAIGLTLPASLGGGLLPVATASEIEAHITCTAPGGVVSCVTTGSHITHLCPANQACQDYAGTAQTIPINLTGVATGSITIAEQTTLSSDQFISGTGLSLIMLDLQLSLTGALGGQSVYNIQLAEADALIGGVVLDGPLPTGTATPDPATPIPDPPTPTPTAPVVPAPVDPPPGDLPTSTPTPAPRTPSATPAVPLPFTPPSAPQGPVIPSDPGGPPPPPPTGAAQPPAGPTSQATPRPPGAPAPVATPIGPGQPRPAFTPRPPATGTGVQGQSPPWTEWEPLVALSLLAVLGAAAVVAVVRR